MIKYNHFSVSFEIEWLAIIQCFTVAYPSVISEFIIIMYQLYSRKWLCIKKFALLNVTAHSRQGQGISPSYSGNVIEYLFHALDFIILHASSPVPLLLRILCWGGGDH